MAVSVSPTLRSRLLAGETLPASWYSDPEILRREEECIFRRSWHYAGPLEQVAQSGSSLTCRAGATPIVVARDEHGELRATGRHLARVDSWGPLVLVCPDPDAPQLAEVLGHLPEQIAGHGLDVTGLEYRGRSREQVLDANWKVVVENFLECYHCPTAHKSFSKVIDVDPEAYVLESGRWTSSQYGPARSGDELPYDTRGEIRTSQFHYIWPDWTLNVVPGPAHLRVIVFQPLGPDRTASFVDGFWAPAVSDATIQEINDFGAEVGAEDRVLVESVHRGLRSGAIDHGRLLVRTEGLIQHFQLLVHDALEGG